MPLFHDWKLCRVAEEINDLTSSRNAMHHFIVSPCHEEDGIAGELDLVDSVLIRQIRARA